VCTTERDVKSSKSAIGRTRNCLVLAVGALFTIVGATELRGAEPKAASSPSVADPIEDQFGHPPREAESERGHEIYLSRCAKCHDHAHDNIPMRLALELKSPEGVSAALTTGPMRAMAEGLSAADMREVAIFLTGKNFGSEAPNEANRCSTPVSSSRLQKSDWPFWGRDVQNTLYQSDESLTSDGVGNLELQWAFAYPGGAATAEPVAAGGRLFLLTANGLFALDAAKGCTYWFSPAGAGGKMPTAAEVGPTGHLMLFFGDANAQVYAVDAADGKTIWSSKIDPHANARVTGPVTYFEGRLYVPVSSMEDPLSYDPAYACCTFRGSVVALDASTGQILWKTYTIQQEPKDLHRKNSSGLELRGPAGGAVYAPLTIDAKRELLLLATGETYLREGVPGSNSVLALDLNTGTQKWSVQPIPKDNKAHCGNQDEEDGCTSNASPLFEFAAAPALVHLAHGRDIVLAGQKSGVLFGLDPDNGHALWETRVGEGGSLGGIQHGVAVVDGIAYVPVSDSEVKAPLRAGALTAVDAATGKRLWKVHSQDPVCSWGTENCNGAQTGSPAAIPGAVFSGSWDGHIRAYRMKDGTVIWDFDTGKAFKAVNGVVARGGALDGYPVIVAGGWVYVASGAYTINRPGNVLLAFHVDLH
jgi:polyvinyl alcohol dehydrogenase (cytochrome)